MATCSALRGLHWRIWVSDLVAGLPPGGSRVGLGDWGCGAPHPPSYGLDRGLAIMWASAAGASCWGRARPVASRCYCLFQSVRLVLVAGSCVPLAVFARWDIGLWLRWVVVVSGPGQELYIAPGS